MNSLQRKQEIDNDFINEMSKVSPALNKLSKLVKLGADINSLSLETGFNCLMDAIYTIPKARDNFLADANLITFLINNGANINHSDSEGFSPLHCAIWGHLDKNILEILLENGAYPNYLFLLEGTVLDIQTNYSFGGEYQKIEDATIQLLKDYNAKFSYELNTTQIIKYLDFQLHQNPNFCFSSLMGFLNQGLYKGITTTELNELLLTFNELQNIKIVDVDSEDYNRIISFNQTLLNISKRIKTYLSEEIDLHLTLFDIFPKGKLCFGKRLLVQRDSCLPTFTLNNLDIINDAEPF